MCILQLVSWRLSAMKRSHLMSGHCGHTVVTLCGQWSIRCVICSYVCLYCVISTCDIVAICLSRLCACVSTVQNSGIYLIISAGLVLASGQFGLRGGGGFKVFCLSP